MQAARAWGRGLHSAAAGEDAVFGVQMVTRTGENATVGGDHVEATLFGPSIVPCQVN